MKNFLYSLILVALLSAHISHAKGGGSAGGSGDSSPKNGNTK